MGIGNFFHKIGVGFTRLGENSIPHTSQAKRYGNWGEDEFVYHIKNHLSNCQIKRNVVIHTLDGNAEIDCLILYNNKCKKQLCHIFLPKHKSFFLYLLQTNF